MNADALRQRIETLENKLDRLMSDLESKMEEDLEAAAERIRTKYGEKMESLQSKMSYAICALYAQADVIELAEEETEEETEELNQAA